MQIPLPSLSAIISCLFLCTYAQDLFAKEDSVRGPFRTFKTQPLYKSLILNITQNSHADDLAPGYWFLTPYVSDFKKGSYGPQLFDNNGTLIWYGNDSVQVRAMDSHVCSYLGESGKHICLNDAAPVEQGGHSSGSIRFLDDTYTEVATVYDAQGDLRAPDIHELNVPEHTKGFSLLQDVYQPRSMNMSGYSGPENGTILDGCFQEINLNTSAVLFEWCALDHIHIDDTYTFMWGQVKNYSVMISGDGTAKAPWDFFHINSIDKNEENDYLVSARHFDTLFKIAGINNTLGKPPGQIIWRLGGKKNDFKMNGFEIHRQHTARFLKSTHNETVISLFDNQSDGAKNFGNSTGRIVSLNNETMEATQLRGYPSPLKKISVSQGSMQVLDNQNVAISWGNEPFFSELSENGTVLFHAEYEGRVESFRIWKYPWTGRPKTKPTAILYAHNITTAPMYAYVSWNGATEVRSWRFWFSYNRRWGPWHYAGTFAKDGFETFVNFSTPINIATFAPHVYVEALDQNDFVLARTDMLDTFVPGPSVGDYCNTTMCDIEYFTYPADVSSASAYRSRNVAGYVAAIILVVAFEGFALAMAIFGWDAIVKVTRQGQRRAKGHLRFSSTTAISLQPLHKGRSTSPLPSPSKFSLPPDKGKAAHKRVTSMSTGLTPNLQNKPDRLVKKQPYGNNRSGDATSQAVSPVKHRRAKSLGLDMDGVENYNDEGGAGYPNFGSPIDEADADANAQTPLINLQAYAQNQRKSAKSPMPSYDGPELDPGSTSKLATSRDRD